MDGQKSMFDFSTCPAVVEHGAPREMKKGGACRWVFQNAFCLSTVFIELLYKQP